MNMRVLRFRYHTKVKDGFDGDVLKNEVKLLVEAMGHNLLDFAYKEDDYNLPPSAPVKMKCFDTLTFYVEGILIESMKINTKLHELEKKLDTLKIYGGSFEV